MTRPIVYLVQSHDAPELLARLVARLRAAPGPRLVLVAHDASRAALPPGCLPTAPDVVLWQRPGPVHRGELSCLAPWLDASRWLLANQVEFEWLVYLSGRDYPLRPVADIERDLRAEPADGLLPAWDVESPTSPWGLRRGRRRYWHHYRRLANGWRAPLRALRPLLPLAGYELSLTYGVHLGRRARPPLFGPDYRCYGGLQWHSLRRMAVVACWQQLTERPEVLDYFRATLVPDEALVQTVLHNTPGLRLLPQSRRYADTHERPGGHSRVLTLEDFPALTSGAYDFARRVDAVESRELLARLDGEVHGV